MLTFEILADPIPLSRPKFSGHRAYLPARSREYRELVQVVVQSIMRSRHIAPLTGELNCRLSFYRRFKTTARNFGDIDNQCKIAHYYIYYDNKKEPCKQGSLHLLHIFCKFKEFINLSLNKVKRTSPEVLLG